MRAQIILFFLAIIIFSSNLFLTGAEPILILNAENGTDTPARNFRWSSKPFGLWVRDAPTRKGLDQLNISGSGQFSSDQLDGIFEKVGSPSKFFVVDLRQECHGFINGNAVSWYALRNWSNIGKTTGEIEALELELLGKLKALPEVTAQMITKDNEGGIDTAKPFLMVPKVVQNEEELVKSKGWNYVRIPVTDHLKPSPEAIRTFLEFYKSLPSDAWVHFHCAAGDGRTTTFMALFDMLRNAKEVSFDEIIARQYALGGIDLLRIPHHKRWKHGPSKERVEFLRAFYTETRAGKI